MPQQQQQQQSQQQQQHITIQPAYAQSQSVNLIISPSANTLGKLDPTQPQQNMLLQQQQQQQQPHQHLHSHSHPHLQQQQPHPQQMHPQNPLNMDPTQQQQQQQQIYSANNANMAPHMLKSSENTNGPQMAPITNNAYTLNAYPVTTQQQMQQIPTSTNNNQQQQQQAAGGGAYAVNPTMSFIDKQQQLINENLQTASYMDPAAAQLKQSPGKKLTKKQLLQQQQQPTGTDLNSGGENELTAGAGAKKKQRQIRPKKSSLENSMTGEGGDEEKCTLSATTQSKIEATIDDFMKQYKLKTKKTKKSKKENENPNNNAESEDNESENEDSEESDNDSDSEDEELTGEELRMRKSDEKDATFEATGNNSTLIGSDGDTSRLG